MSLTVDFSVPFNMCSAVRVTTVTPRKQRHRKIGTHRLIFWKNTPKDKNQKQTDFSPCSYKMVHYTK